MSAPYRWDFVELLSDVRAAVSLELGVETFPWPRADAPLPFAVVELPREPVVLNASDMRGGAQHTITVHVTVYVSRADELDGYGTAAGYLSAGQRLGPVGSGVVTGGPVGPALVGDVQVFAVPFDIQVSGSRKRTV